MNFPRSQVAHLSNEGIELNDLKDLPSIYDPLIQIGGGAICIGVVIEPLGIDEIIKGHSVKREKRKT